MNEKLSQYWRIVWSVVPGAHDRAKERLTPHTRVEHQVQTHTYLECISTVWAVHYTQKVGRTLRVYNQPPIP